MLMDGQFGQISFIATKTDDINSSETINALATVSRTLRSQPMGLLQCQHSMCSGMCHQLGMSPSCSSRLGYIRLMSQL